MNSRTNTVEWTWRCQCGQVGAFFATRRGAQDDGDQHLMQGHTEGEQPSPSLHRVVWTPSGFEVITIV